MVILAIETSCDDTCIAIVEAKGRKRPRFKILANVVSSQIEVHKKYGGVYPSLAKREHERNLPKVLKRVLASADLVNAIAVTVGPGLDPCLWAGVNFAKGLAKNWNLPIVPVNHIEAHILVNFIDQIQNFPAMALIVSGGHTQLILVKDIGKYKIIGETRDDAAGECFDKVAKILGLGYPGGPIIAKLATERNVRSSVSNIVSIKLPRPMINQKNYDFSFSGLKTAVLYKVRNTKAGEKKKKEFIQEMCREAQQAVIDVLIKKTIRAAKEYRVKSVILGGGVSANQELRKRFLRETRPLGRGRVSLKLLFPDEKFSTDNAVMTGIAGYYNYLQGKTGKIDKIRAEANLRIN